MMIKALPNAKFHVLAWLIALASAPAALAATAALARLDVTSTAGWVAAHGVAPITTSPEGLVIQAIGEDPYAIGPRFDLPAGQPLWLMVRMRCQEAGMLQVFYFHDQPTEEKSVRVDVKPGVWQTHRLSLPPLGPGTHLRIDPPSDTGRTTIAALWFEPRTVLKAPAWPIPAAPALPQNAPAIESGQLKLTHAPDRIGAFTLELAGHPLAAGNSQPLAGYFQGDTPRWVNIGTAGKTTATLAAGALTVHSTFSDADGASWQLVRRFTPAGENAIAVTLEASVDRDRAVIFLPLLNVFPGLGSYGTHKSQALFPGLEYLGRDELSSSELDIIGPGALRRVPDPIKITIPMMTVVQDGRYLALAWKPQPSLAALFDSPDRTFGSAAHVMGLIFPGAEPEVREDGHVLPESPVTLAAGKPFRAQAMLFAGQGASAVAALQQYLHSHALPPTPPAPPPAEYFTNAAHGWLDSQARDGSDFRHAWPGQFQPHPAADPAFYMEGLAARLNDATLVRRLQSTARDALAQVKPPQYLFACVSHIQNPATALAFDQALPAVDAARGQATGLLGRFSADGTIPYRPGQTDLGRGHFAPDANGLTAQVVLQLLKSATLCGDPALVDTAIQRLRDLDKFDNTVPRGAQTWEVPLHTPDILASAHLVHAYAIGYQVTGDPALLERARYWAWTGLPFVYLDVPPGLESRRDVLPYATIAVYGATQWRAPNWMGLPVQWCGLVYADALNALAPLDPSFDWQRIADGITISGINQSFPTVSASKRQGMLPDSYALRAGHRNDPGINPGTVQALAMPLYAHTPIYSFRCLRSAGRIMLHAPGAVKDLVAGPARVGFQFTPLLPRRSAVLLSNCPAPVRVVIDAAVAPADTWTYDARRRCLVIRTTGPATIAIDLVGDAGAPTR